MSDAVMKYARDYAKDYAKEERAEGERLAILRNIRSLMETMKLTASQAMDALKITKEQQSQYLQLLETV